MKTILRFLTVFGLLAVAARAQVTDTYWDFGSNPKHLSTNVTGGVMAANNFDVLYTPAFDMVNHSNPGDLAGALNGRSGMHNASVEVQNFAGPITDLADANNPTATYFEFTLAPNPGLQLQATYFELGSRNETGFGPTTLTLVASIDGFSTDMTILGTTTMTANSTWNLVTLPTFSYTAAVNTPVTFRIYGTDGTGGLAVPNWRIDDVTLSVVAVPEPSTYASLLVGVVLLGARALRRRKSAVA